VTDAHDVRVDAPIPTHWDDVDPAWMTTVLGVRFPGIEVAAVDPLSVSDGSNRRARFGLTYASGEGPAVVFVKAEGEHRDVHARNGNLFNESRLYASGTPLPVDHPEPYGVIIDEPALDWLVVMEDVTSRGADPRDATRPYTPAQVTAGVRGLARLHRAHWRLSSRDRSELDWVQTWAPTEGFRSGLARRVPTGLERGGGELPPEVMALGADGVMDLWTRYVDLLDREPTTLLHADAHIGNTYLLPASDDVGFLDWQVARRGNWSQDTGHFIQGALTEKDRRTHDRAVVDAYRAELARGDVALDADEAWTWYRASAAYGLAVWASTLGTDGYQSREISLTLARRFSIATVELATADAIAALEAAA
jgi:aminoglycoside phosphotransferase (APT) family kinase protein